MQLAKDGQEGRERAEGCAEAEEGGEEEHLQATHILKAMDSVLCTVVRGIRTGLEGS